MSLSQELRQVTELLRSGGSLTEEGLHHVESQLLRRQQDLLQELQLPVGLDQVQQLLSQTLEEYQVAWQALRLAFSEDTPELASWVEDKVQEADDTLRLLRQTLNDFSHMLNEEACDGDF